VSGLTFPLQIIAIIVRKAIGLGAQAITGGSTHVPMYSGAWPTASLGPMGFEGAVKLGFKVELDAIADLAERQKRFDELVSESLDRGSAQSTASLGETDEVSFFLQAFSVPVNECSID
jgi:acetyl-CoA carboxylase carboxyltransferase component